MSTPLEATPAPAAKTRIRRIAVASVLLPLLALGAAAGLRHANHGEAAKAVPAVAQPGEETRDLTFKALEFNPGPAFADIHVTSNMAVKLPPEILALDGKRVRITGFLVPILNVGGHIREFFITASQTSCCFGTPPRLFDFIDAKMPSGTDAKYMGEPTVFEGVLHVRKTPAEDEWIPVFTMDCEDVYRD